MFALVGVLVALAQTPPAPAPASTPPAQAPAQAPAPMPPAPSPAPAPMPPAPAAAPVPGAPAAAPTTTPMATPTGSVPSTLGPVAVGTTLVQMTFPSTDTCSANSAGIQTAVVAACSGCTATSTCNNGVATVRVWGPAASIAALATAVRSGSVAGVPATADWSQAAVSPSGTVTPSTIASNSPVSSGAYFRATTLTAVDCANQATCVQAAQAANPTGTYVISCQCAASRAGIMNVFVSPASAVDPWTFAQAVAAYFNTCVNVYAPNATVMSAAACPKKGSKKGLLGLLGLLGLIPLFLVLLLCCLCCLRRRKTSRDVHFATFDPAPPNVAMAPSCVPAPCVPASVCAPAPVCAP